MAATKSLSVDGADLRDAFEFVSSGGWLENSAYVCLDTGAIHWTSMSGEFDEDEDLPDDLEDADRYVSVPHKNDLDLGEGLLLQFIAQELPEGYESADEFLLRNKAYRRVKDLLEAHGLLQRWYEFESRATEAALLAWCAENGLQVV